MNNQPQPEIISHLLISSDTIKCPSMDNKSYVTLLYGEDRNYTCVGGNIEDLLALTTVAIRARQHNLPISIASEEGEVITFQ